MSAAHEPDTRLAVVVSDPDFVRREHVVSLIAQVGGRAIAEDAAFAQLALVALAPGAVDAVRMWTARGVPVIAYGSGVDRLPLADRCRVLLAGAREMIDDGRDALQPVIERELQGLRGRADRDLELKVTMRRLGFIVESRAMLRIVEQLIRISALSDVPMLITGETGTGKQLVAEALHALDRKRSSAPFVAVNCGAITATIAEAELFGHRRGAFTGAERDRKGLVRAADGGVLFLDELGELNAAVQAKLLRVVQDQRVLAVGEDQESPVDVRIVAATNEDLPSAVGAGRFRQDLFHRLNVVAIHVPPLRERREDIPPLVSHFLDKHRALAPHGPTDAGADFIEALTAFDLPGNVRQLENLVRRALVTATSGTLTLGDLPRDVWSDLTAARHPVPEEPASGTFIDQLLDAHQGNLSAALHACERAIITAALGRANGSQTRTARMLGITPRSVYNKLRRHRLGA